MIGIQYLSPRDDWFLNESFPNFKTTGGCYDVIDWDLTCFSMDKGRSVGQVVGEMK